MSAHTRPVDALAFEPKNETSCTLFTADTMGVINVWELERWYGDASSCRATLKTSISCHRTGVNDIWVGKGFMWSGKRSIHSNVQRC